MVAAHTIFTSLAMTVQSSGVEWARLDPVDFVQMPKKGVPVATVATGL